MAKDKLKEKEKRKAEYSYEIGLLLRGMSVKEVFLLSSTLGNHASSRTISRLKREYTDFPCDR